MRMSSRGREGGGGEYDMEVWVGVRYQTGKSRGEFKERVGDEEDSRCKRKLRENYLKVN